MPTIPVKTAIDPITGLHYRSDRGELYVIRHQTEYDTLDFNGRVVMDCGAHVGSFADKAIKGGAVKVYSYEPTPAVFQVLKKNRKPEMEIYNAALSDVAGACTLRTHKKWTASNSIVLSKKSWGAVTVRGLSFWDELDKHKPSCVKIDVEGAEYKILTRPMPKYVEEFAVEFHDLFNPKAMERVKYILSLFNGWNCMTRFRFIWPKSYGNTLVLSRHRIGLGLIQDVAAHAEKEYAVKLNGRQTKHKSADVLSLIQTVEEPVQILVDATTGLHYRPDYGEEKIIVEMDTYKKLDVNQRIVMDCGANIGCFARKAIVGGAKVVHCYEPCPDTFSVLALNKVDQMVIHNKALMPNSGVTKLMISPGRPSANSVCIGSSKRDTIEVAAVSFWDEVERIKPYSIKMDIEGAEYSLLNKPLPNYVKEIAIELHDIRKTEGLDKAKKLLSLFVNWQVHKKCVFSWYITTGVFSRVRKGLCTVKEMLEAIESRWKAKHTEGAGR